MNKIGRVFAQVEILEYDEAGNLTGSQMQQAILHYPHAGQLESFLQTITKGLNDGKDNGGGAGVQGKAGRDRQTKQSKPGAGDTG
jgi:hypothetical protein